MGVERFKTKKAILLHIGKNPRDNKLVDRMIASKRMGHDADGYYIIDVDEVEELQRIVKEKDELVLEFARRNNELEHEIDRLKDTAWREDTTQAKLPAKKEVTDNVVNTTGIEKCHIEYLYDIAFNSRKAVESIFWEYYQATGGGDYDKRKDDLFNKVKYLPSSDDLEELKYIGDLISKLK